MIEGTAPRITLAFCAALILVAGPSRSAADFVDNGVTITDTRTGLMWEKKTGAAGGLHDPNATRPWDHSGETDGLWTWLARVNAENGTGLAGYDDWRIPSMKELATLLPVAGETPPVGLPQSGNYWTSTQQFWYVASPSTEPQWSMCIDFSNQIVHDTMCCWHPQVCPVPSQAHAIAVRDAPCAVAQSGIRDSFGDDAASTLLGSRFDFEIRPDGTILDHRTGLMWEKKTRGSADPNSHDADTPMTAPEAEAWASELVLAGYDDWRLPTPMELLSLVDNSQSHNFGLIENVSIAPAFNLNCTPADQCDLGNASCSCTKGGDTDAPYWSSHGLWDYRFAVRHWDAWSMFRPDDQPAFVRAVREAAAPQGPACDDDALADADDPCLFHPNSWPLEDVNEDGIPNECQCGDWNENGALDNNDLLSIHGCLTGIPSVAVCDSNLAKGDANGNGAFDSGDLTEVHAVLTGVQSSHELRCARRPEGTPPPSLNPEPGP